MELSRMWIFVDYWVIFTASQLWINANCQPPPGYKIFVNSPVSVQRGLCVHIPCTFTVPARIRLTPHANGYWYKANRQGKPTPVAARENGVYYTNGRVHMTGDVTRGDCSYYIEEPLREDQGSYAFRIEDSTTMLTYTDTTPNVYVKDLTDKPTISSTKLVDGREVTLTCTSPGRCRNITPRISWAGAITDTKQEIYNMVYGDGSRTFHSNITFTPRRSHNKSGLLCIVTLNNNLVTTQTQMLNVEYSPSMNITVEGADTNDTTQVFVKDGDSITLKCIVDSNPDALVTWYKDGLVIHQNISHQTMTHELFIITTSDAGRFQCSAMNEHGVTNRSVEIIHHSGMDRMDGMASSIFLISMVISGIVILILIIVGSCLFLKRCMKKRQLGKASPDPPSSEIESTYQELKGQENNIYDSLKVE